MIGYETLPTKYLKISQKTSFCPKSGIILSNLIMDVLYDGSLDEQSLTVIKDDQKKRILQQAQRGG